KSKELLETLRTTENCASCKDKIEKNINLDSFYESINEIENELQREGQEEKKKEHNLHNELIKVDSELNRLILCKNCKGKKSDKLINELTNILNELVNKSY